MKYSTLSTTLVSGTSWGGTRDVSADFSNYLESSETLSSVTVTVSDDDVISISNGTINSQVYNFTVSAYPTKVNTTASIFLHVVGSAGSQDVFEIEQPLSKTVKA